MLPVLLNLNLCNRITFKQPLQAKQWFFHPEGSRTKDALRSVISGNKNKKSQPCAAYVLVPLLGLRPIEPFKTLKNPFVALPVMSYSFDE